jgi:hypothetical protein
MAWRGKRASALYENDDSGEGINAQVNKLRGTVDHHMPLLTLVQLRVTVRQAALSLCMRPKGLPTVKNGITLSSDKKSRVSGRVKYLRGISAFQHHVHFSSYSVPLTLFVTACGSPCVQIGQNFHLFKFLIFILDEREAVQGRTFTKWVNSQLSRHPQGVKIENLYRDLYDGKNLIRLLHVLSGEHLKIPNTRGRMRIHAMENVQRAIDFLREKQVPMENIGNHDIVDGNHRIILGLIWTVILRFQVQFENTIRHN